MQFVRCLLLCKHEDLSANLEGSCKIQTSNILGQLQTPCPVIQIRRVGCTSLCNSGLAIKEKTNSVLIGFVAHYTRESLHLALQERQNQVARESLSLNGKTVPTVVLDGCDVPAKLPSTHVCLCPSITAVISLYSNHWKRS